METTPRTKRISGNHNPAYLLGRPRSFWTDAMGPKRRTIDSIHLDGPMFDIDEIMADLCYGVGPIDRAA